MINRPSKIISDLIHKIQTEPLAHSEIVSLLIMMRLNFEKDEAQAVRDLTAIMEYHGVQVS